MYTFAFCALLQILHTLLFLSTAIKVKMTKGFVRVSSTGFIEKMRVPDSEYFEKTL